MFRQYCKGRKSVVGPPAVVMMVNVWLQGAVASTSSTPPVSASASMPDNASSEAKPKTKGIVFIYFAFN